MNNNKFFDKVSLMDHEAIQPPKETTYEFKFKVPNIFKAVKYLTRSQVEQILFRNLYFSEIYEYMEKDPIRGEFPKIDENYLVITVSIKDVKEPAITPIAEKLKDLLNSILVNDDNLYIMSQGIAYDPKKHRLLLIKEIDVTRNRKEG